MMHDLELAAWVLGAAASVAALVDRKRAIVWLGVAGALCNVALVIKNA